MERIKSFFLVILVGVCGILLAENVAVRSDIERMRYAYGTFLMHKSHGKPLLDRIQPAKLALFQSEQGIVACSMMKGG